MLKRIQAAGVVLFLLLYIIIAQSCNQGYSNDPAIKGETADVEGLKVVRIDGCQYIMFRTHLANSITHKGDCDNSIHKLKP